MTKIEERNSTNFEKCDICGRRTWFGSIWVVEVSTKFQIEPLKWNFCTNCCHSKEHAEILCRELMTYFALPLSDE